MADLCSKCANYEKCIEENGFDDCITNDYISYSPKGMTCEGCFYEDWAKLTVFSPCWKCMRQPVRDRVDNYISKNSERNKYNE